MIVAEMPHGGVLRSATVGSLHCVTPSAPTCGRTLQASRDALVQHLNGLSGGAADFVWTDGSLQRELTALRKKRKLGEAGADDGADDCAHPAAKRACL